MRLTPRANLWLAGGIAYVICLVATIPAEIGASVIAQRSAGRLILLGTKGSVWNGSAREAWIVSGPTRAVIRDIRWRVSPFSLLRLRLVGDISVEGSSQATVIVTRSAVRMKDVALELPANAVGVMVPALALWDPGGTLTVKTAFFYVGNDHAEGSAYLVWRALSTPLSRVNPLGDYSATFTGSARGTEFRIATLTGPMQLTGAGVWRNVNDWKFIGDVRATSRQAELASLIRLFDPSGATANARIHLSSSPAIKKDR